MQQRGIRLPIDAAPSPSGLPTRTSDAARGLVLIEQCSENHCELNPLQLIGGERERNPSLWLPEQRFIRISGMIIAQMLRIMIFWNRPCEVRQIFIVRAT
jgi:hypothetical protein